MRTHPNEITIIAVEVYSLRALVGCIKKKKGEFMLFALFYVVAITILILHFTGFLARHNLEWLVLVLAASVFPAVLYL